MEESGIPNPYNRQGEEQPFGYTGYRHDDISGTYFAQAREYQPESGRFTAEDVIKGNGAVPETLNRYGYCLGNPVMLVDRDGRKPDTSTIMEVFTYLVEDTITNGGQSGDKDTMDTINTAVHISRIIAGSYDATFSVGGNVSGTPGIWQFDGSLGISIDTKGNIGVQGTFADGVTIGGPSVALFGYYSRSNAPDIYALEGEGVNIGGSASTIPISPSLAVGGDFNLIGDVNSTPYDGYYGDTFSVDVAMGYEGHVENAYTATFFSFNVFDWWNAIYNNHKRNGCEVME